MHLTDDPANPAEWTFPNGATIRANGYLLFYARVPTPAASERTFGLSKDGEYLAFTTGGHRGRPSFTFPAQFDDVSYGTGSTAWSAT